MSSIILSASELGSKRINISDLIDLPEDKLKQLYLKTGISHVFKVSPSENVVSMSISSINKLKKLYPTFNLSLVNTLIHCTQTATGYLPGDGFRIQAAAGLNKECTVIDLNSGCSGFVLSLFLALASKNIFGNTLITTSDAYSTVMREDSRSTQAIFSDGASATFLDLKKLNSANIIGFDSFSDGNSRSAIEIDSISGELSMNGPAVYLFTQSVVLNSIQKLLRKTSVKIESIDKFYFHQPSRLVLDGLISNLNLNKEKVIGFESKNLVNITSSSIPYLLHNFESIQEGDTVLFCGFGVGLTCSTLLIEF